MTEQQYPTREQITTAVRPVISQWYDTGGNLQERIADVVLALFPQPTQECGVCGSQYPADDPHDTCPVCWPGFGEHGQQATASTERKPSGCPCGYHPIDSPNASGPLPAAPPSIADMAQMDLAAQTAAVRYVDAEYMEEGGSTRHWVQALNRAGYVIAPDPSTIRDVTPPPKTPEAN